MDNINKELGVAIIKSILTAPSPDYAKEYGRPPISELPYMSSENDGYPYLSGHAPNCSGPEEAYAPAACWCDWIGYK